jgi:carbon storage regulator CsrA
MLVLSRKVGEKIIIPELNTSIEIVEVKAGRVRVGIDAPRSVRVVREEIASTPEAAPPHPPRTSKREAEHKSRNLMNALSLGLELAHQQIKAGLKNDACETMRRLLEQLNPEGAATPDCSATPEATPKATIMVVEDDPSERDMLASLLRSASFDVTTAIDGVDALNRLQSHAAPDLILLDMMMPRCDGMSTVRILRRNPVFDQIKIAAMSGYGPEHFGVAERAAGIDAWYQKPVEPAYLIGQLKEMTGCTAATC